MLKNLFAYIARLVSPAPLTALQVMKASLARAEIIYLRTLDEKEYHACQAEMKAVEAKHDFNRCKRLQQFIEQEQCAQAEANQEDSLADDLASILSLFDSIGKIPETMTDNEYQRQQPEPKA